MAKLKSILSPKQAEPQVQQEEFGLLKAEIWSSALVVM